MNIFSPKTTLESAKINENFAEVTALQTTVANDGTGWSTTSILSTSDTDVSMGITLPDIGTWIVIAKVRCRLDTTTAGRYIRVKLKQNLTTEIAESISCYEADRGTHSIHNEPLHAIVTTTTENETVDITGAVSSTSGVTASSIESDGNGYTTMIAQRIT